MTENKEIKLKDIPLTEEEVKRFRIALSEAELIKDRNDLQEEVYEYSIKNEIPNLKVKAQVYSLEKTLENGKGENNVELSEFDIGIIKSLILQLNNSLKLDIPMRDERIKLRKFKESRTHKDSKELQIPRFKKIIREKKLEQEVPEVK